mmetsp:Transcript_2611/g.5796  ORF Transcript_2611/g.5796 Transcript_2611/m.5796 type:complete len:164 (-) Transcript_2611:126-617(-)
MSIKETVSRSCFRESKPNADTPSADEKRSDGKNVPPGWLSAMQYIAGMSDPISHPEAARIPTWLVRAKSIEILVWLGAFRTKPFEFRLEHRCANRVVWKMLRDARREGRAGKLELKQNPGQTQTSRDDHPRLPLSETQESRGSAVLKHLSLIGIIANKGHHNN